MPKVVPHSTHVDKPNREERLPFVKLFELFGGCSFSVTGDEAHADQCPFCSKSKFYVNTKTGQYKCQSANSCGAEGNAFTFIRWAYSKSLETTTDSDYHRLQVKRNLPLQTFKRHGLAWNAQLGCWLVPFKDVKGAVLNLLRYFPESGDKLTLPGLPLKLYGLDKLSNDRDRILFLTEGPFDAIALDQHLTSKKTRNRYDILAVPSANGFPPDWFQHLKGRTVRLVFDNDKAGRDSQQRIVKLAKQEKVDVELHCLNWPQEYQDKFDIADLIRSDQTISVVDFTRQHCVKAALSESRILLKRGTDIQPRTVDWMWDGHIQFGTFASLSGIMGSSKSTLARNLAACATAGLPMPLADDALPPFDVIYFTSEDSESVVCDIVRLHRGNVDRLHVHDMAETTEPIDFLDSLEEIEEKIKEVGARLVILDALNSFVGGDISTDAKARRTLSGRLQGLARRTGACILGIRNWGKQDHGTSHQKTLGATSLSDVARCVMNTEKLSEGLFRLEFEKVSDAPQPKPLRFYLENRSTCKADLHLRTIVWEKPINADDVKKAISQSRKKGSAKKGSTDSASHYPDNGAGSTGRKSNKHLHIPIILYPH